MTLARITKRTTYWARREARETNAAQSEEIPPAEDNSPLDTEGHGSCVPAAASPSPTPTLSRTNRRLHSEAAVELPAALRTGGRSHHEAAGELPAPAPSCSGGVTTWLQ